MVAPGGPDPKSSRDRGPWFEPKKYKKNIKIKNKGPRVRNGPAPGGHWFEA